MGSEYTLTGAFRATSPTSVQLDIPIVSDQERLGFNVRKFANQWNLNGAKGGGVHMWREVWEDDVSLIYRDILGMNFCLTQGWHSSYFFLQARRNLSLATHQKWMYMRRWSSKRNIFPRLHVPVGSYFLPFCILWNPLPPPPKKAKLKLLAAYFHLLSANP